MAVRYGTFRICVLRTLIRTVPAYRTRTVTKKGVPYQRTLLLSENLGVPYRTYVPYRTAILAFNYLQL